MSVHEDTFFSCFALGSVWDIGHHSSVFLNSKLWKKDGCDVMQLMPWIRLSFGIEYIRIMWMIRTLTAVINDGSWWLIQQHPPTDMTVCFGLYISTLLFHFNNKNNWSWRWLTSVDTDGEVDPDWRWRSVVSVILMFWWMIPNEWIVWWSSSVTTKKEKKKKKNRRIMLNTTITWITSSPPVVSCEIITNVKHNTISLINTHDG